MGKEIVKRKFENIKDILLNPDKYKKDVIYVIALKNCNGITTELLNSLELLPIDIKFKIDGDLFSSNLDCKDELNDNIIYNYNIDQMKEIISYFEEIINAMPEMNQIGKFLFIYTILCSETNYDNSFGMDFENYCELESLKRSIYGALINGEGVCVADSLALYNLLSYAGINCKQLSGIAHLSNGTSGGHAWNTVEIDGLWYYVDSIWDINDMINWKNCLVVNDDFQSSHELNIDSHIKMSDCVVAPKDYDHEFIKQGIYHLSKNYIIKKQFN